MSIWDTICSDCTCHIDELLKNKKCVCGSYYGKLDDDMCRVCESIHCECGLEPWDAAWAREKWAEKEKRKSDIN